jgi:hypothetical protein
MLSGFDIFTVIQVQYLHSKRPIIASEGCKKDE